MGDTKIDFLNAAKLLLGIEGNESDELLTCLINDTENAVLSYCHIDVLPRQLEGFVPQIAAHRFAENKQGNIKLIAEGERRVEYGDGKSSFLSDYHERLSPFVSREVWLPSDNDKGDTKNG